MKKTFWILVVIVTAVHCKKESTSTTPINALNILATGKSAHDLLSADTYTQLNIEIEYMPGMQLESASINNLVNFLNTYLNKPAGITVTQKQVISFNADTVSIRQVADFETQYRDIYTSGNVISAYILVSDANSSSPDVLGTAYLNTSLVMYEKNIRSFSGGFGQATREKVESGVMEHEFGHILGLVNLGSPMVTPHEDPEHTHHCDNSNCLMYYEMETSGLTRAINNTVPSLDQHCIDDLKANGGK